MGRKIVIQKFEFKEFDLKDSYIIKPFYATDERGGLIKDYNIDVFKEAGIAYDLKETFYTISKANVIRALHFQLYKPQPKLMRCVSGRVFYVIVDLRPKSETFGQYRHMELNGDELKIDGNLAVCWSSSLSFTVERSTKTLLGSAVSGEGLVNVYRGTGKVLLAPVRDGAV